ncbi:uncharacterized protein MONBRDRAFT_10348 [Monosiga brevicollis MX1]|uniref:Helicase ATP-binding domain-containing protein n=2 Tax=Monosiga brevicollis TaxID=81824 RepID=A9V5Y8_MONBE|nr:uncharacterized protein MONBRDRAFT_10348 [Monosiga brevicollis MX1]EDQ87131.1 predicted protein [Monosiga brevicollis MX1]|eukprot:XP_001748074.1 hypothetical protein [Monosiga brevicollis MX1]
MVYTSLFYRDSSASPRNVFFSGNRLAFVARRGKTTWISNRESHAAHYMDKRASAVMMAYLLLCKPLEELFADDLQDRDELITSSAIDPNSLTEEEQDELEADAMKVEDSIEPDTVGSVDDQHDDLRAAKPFIGGVECGTLSKPACRQDGTDVYGRTQLDHKFVSSEAQYGHQFVSEEWHKLMKLVDVEDQIQAEAVDGQTCVQQVVHKQVVIQSSRVRNASTQVQATVGTQTDLEVEACLDAEDDIDDIIAGVEDNIRDWDQYRLAQAVTRHEAQDGWLLAVAPTGMGKTRCTLAHLQPRKVVVWIVPLRELARDWCRRFEQADIVSQWAKNDGRDMQVNVQVIVMTVDFLVGYGMRWVQTLVQQKRLAMLVMDEVHTMLVDTSYRGSLVRCPSRLDHLRQDPSVKCVGLTGTLCPKDERALLQQLDSWIARRTLRTRPFVCQPCEPIFG